MLLEGIFAAATTPFYPDGSLYLRKLEHNMERYSRTPVAGITVLGSTAKQCCSMTQRRAKTLRTAALAAAPEKVLLAGVGQGSAMRRSAWRSLRLQPAYDAALVRTPHYYAPQMSPLAMLTYYRTVADHSPIRWCCTASPVHALRPAGRSDRCAPPSTPTS